MSSPPQDDQPQKSGAEGEQLNNGLEEGSVADQPGYRKSVWVPGGMRERQRRYELHQYPLACLIFRFSGS